MIFDSRQDNNNKTNPPDGSHAVYLAPDFEKMKQLFF